VEAALAAAPSSRVVLPVLKFTVYHGGCDGYEVDKSASFTDAVRLQAHGAAHRQGWPKPATIVRAEVSILAHGTERCGPKTLEIIAQFLGKQIYAEPLAGIIAEPTKVADRPARLEITVCALEVVQIEDAADRAARLAREATAPAMRQDGTYEGELRPGETPAFIQGQGVAEVDPLAERLDRIERGARISDLENEIDPPSVIHAEDPDNAIRAWKSLTSRRVDLTGGSSSGRLKKSEAGNPLCQCGHRSSRHGEMGSGVGCLLEGCGCEFFLQARFGEDRQNHMIRLTRKAKVVLSVHPGLARQALEALADELLASGEVTS
jgi:hypothetical protein